MSSHTIYALRTAEDWSARIHSSLKIGEMLFARSTRLSPCSAPVHLHWGCGDDEGLDDEDLLPE